MGPWDEMCPLLHKRSAFDGLTQVKLFLLDCRSSFASHTAPQGCDEHFQVLRAQQRRGEPAH
jgi:hypothetical protein